METIEFTQALRQIADFYDKHPEVPLPDLVSMPIYTVNTPEEIAPIARAFGTSFKEYNSTFFKLTKQFGVIKLEVVAYRDQVCVKRVVGTKKVKKQVLAEYQPPANYVEKEVEEEIVEWDCPESILKTPETVGQIKGE